MLIIACFKAVATLFWEMVLEISQTNRPTYPRSADILAMSEPPGDGFLDVVQPINAQ